jgi:predicted tellurium resistance membrane protein TerC
MLANMIADSGSSLAVLGQVLMIDLVLAGDNALAVGLAAGGLPPAQRRRVIARGLAAGLLLSVVLMGLAANLIARPLRRHRRIGYAGLIVVLCVAGRMVWQGHREMVVDLGASRAYDRIAPAALAIPEPAPAAP